ncbi:MAG: hypothetical protein GXC76_02825 [Rhodanobacteraceae bacterium]|jgi:hypothetical protein|nr:hypothetical protein [Rhodanobacteraceae bacterium]
MSDIVFEPWIGSKYRGDNRFGVRVLVLGESHYGDKSETRRTVTTEVVRWLAQDERHAFFTKISKVLLGLDKTTWIDDEVRGEVWEHVAFYNYIQEFVSTDSRVSPLDEMWAAAPAPFLHVLSELEPNVVLVLGKRLSAHLPKIPDGVEICCIQHPSTGFDYGLWNPIFSESVQRARNNSYNT